MAIRDNRIAAEAMGVDIDKVQTYSICYRGVFCRGGGRAVRRQPCEYKTRYV